MRRTFEFPCNEHGEEHSWRELSLADDSGEAIGRRTRTKPCECADERKHPYKVILEESWKSHCGARNACGNGREGKMIGCRVRSQYEVVIPTEVVWKRQR